MYNLILLYHRFYGSVYSHTISINFRCNIFLMLKSYQGTIWDPKIMFNRLKKNIIVTINWSHFIFRTFKSLKIRFIELIAIKSIINLHHHANICLQFVKQFDIVWWIPWHLAISTLTPPIKHESYLSNREENVKVRKEFLDRPVSLLAKV